MSLSIIFGTLSFPIKSLFCAFAAASYEPQRHYEFDLSVRVCVRAYGARAAASLTCLPSTSSSAGVERATVVLIATKNGTQIN